MSDFIKRVTKTGEYFGKGIKVASGFDLSGKAPLDNRTVKPTIVSRDAMPDIQLYNGLVVFVEETNLNYQYVNGAWVPFGAETQVENTLDSTSTTTALSAAQGKVLNDKITAHTDDAVKHITDEERTKWNDTYRKSETYDRSEVDTKVGAKADQTALDEAVSDINGKLDTKVSTETMTAELEKKAEKEHRHNINEIDGAGNVVTKNVGTEAGNVPVLNDSGKLETSILPSIAINNTFTADSIENAMALTVEVGDIVILNTASAEFKAILENPKAVSVAKVSNDTIQLLSSGKVTYMCVDVNGATFDEKFRPLYSSADAVTKSELDTSLASKADKSALDTAKEELNNSIATKVSTTDFNAYKEEVTTNLNGKVDKVVGKELSTNDFTDEYKNKLEGLSNYTHPTGDGNNHVPANGDTNNGNVLMATETAGVYRWAALTADNVAETADKKFLTPEQIAKWDGKAEADHNHDTIYRKISDSYSKAETVAEINKLATVVSNVQPAGQKAGAVWIETA